MASAGTVAQPPSPLATVKMVLPFGVMMFRTRVNEAFPVHIQIQVFAALVILKLALTVLSGMIINRKKDMSEVTEIERDAAGVKKRVKKTAMDYDKAQLQKEFTGTLLGAAIAGFLYYQWKLAPILQIVQAPLEILDNKIFQIHLLGWPAEGTRQRPFPTSDLFSMLGINMNNFEDKMLEPERPQDARAGAQGQEEGKEGKEEGQGDQGAYRRRGRGVERGGCGRQGC